MPTITFRHQLNRLNFSLAILLLLIVNFSHFAYKHFLPGLALIFGVLLTTIQRDGLITQQSKLWSTRVLSYAIILLGFGFNLTRLLHAGASGISYTIISIGGTLILGLSLGALLKNNQHVSTLISCGTAICGGSAIAAIAPIIRANHEQTAVAMGTIFLLNAVGLMLFPSLGHLLHLSQTQFGLLAALAIHDTSSVVGSCLAYGPESLMVGTTVKLVRALWIIPLSLLIALSYARINHHQASTTKTKKPWFIVWFICASLLVTIFPQLSVVGLHLKDLGTNLFIIALFLIGYNVSVNSLKTVGISVFVQALSLWIIVSGLVVSALKLNLIQ